MPIRDDIARRILQSVERLSAALRRQVLRWIRQGLTLPQILDSIRRLPVSAELRALEEEIRRSMEAIGKLETTVKTLTERDVEALLARSDLFTVKIRSEVRDSAVTLIERAIDQGKGVEALTDELRKLSLGNAATLANTSVAGFNNLLTIQQGLAAGIDRFLYDGNLNPNTRPFCRQRVGRVFTLAEIRGMDNGQDLPVDQYMGGYNCTHFWTAAQ